MLIRKVFSINYIWTGLEQYSCPSTFIKFYIKSALHTLLFFRFDQLFMGSSGLSKQLHGTVCTWLNVTPLTDRFLWDIGISHVYKWESLLVNRSGMRIYCNVGSLAHSLLFWVGMCTRKTKWYYCTRPSHQNSRGTHLIRGKFPKEWQKGNLHNT